MARAVAGWPRVAGRVALGAGLLGLIVPGLFTVLGEEASARPACSLPVTGWQGVPADHRVPDLRVLAPARVEEVPSLSVGHPGEAASDPLTADAARSGEAAARADGRRGPQELVRAELQRVEELRLAALHAADESRGQALEALLSWPAGAPEIVAAVRDALLQVAEHGERPVEALSSLPLEAASEEDLARVGALLRTSSNLSAREAAARALARADPWQRGVVVLALESAFEDEEDPLVAKEIAAAALRVSRADPGMLERMCRAPVTRFRLVGDELARWRAAVRRGELDPERILEGAP